MVQTRSLEDGVVFRVCVFVFFHHLLHTGCCCTSISRLWMHVQMLAYAAGVSNRPSKHEWLQLVTRALQQRFFSRITPHPAWWQQGWPRKHPGSVAEAELLAPLAELLMPKTPIMELFRSFPSPKGWQGNYLEPDLAAYGVLKHKDAALFVEYDGYWRHGEKAGMDRDQLKNASLLAYAPPGSKVIRIRHTVTESIDDRTLFICANNWRQGDQRALANSLKCILAEAVSWMKDSLQKDVLTRLHSEIDKEGINWCSRGRYCSKSSWGPKHSRRDGELFRM